MQTFIAISGNKTFTHSLGGCLQWAKDRTEPTKILKARAGERDAKIIAEVVDNEVGFFSNGAYVPVRRL